MKIRQLLLATILLAGCKSAPATPDTPPVSDQERALLELDAKFDEHVEGSALPIRLSGAANLREMLKTKADQLRALEEAYSAYAGTEDTLAHSHAALRVGQLYLNFACELVTTKPPTPTGHFGDAGMDEQFQSVLESQAKPLFLKGRTAIESANKTGGGKYSDTAADLLTRIDAENLGSSCATTEEYWAAANRPEGPPAPEVTAESCMGNNVFAPGENCRPVLTEACAEDDPKACAMVGDLDYRAGETAAAIANYEHACELGHADACRAAAVSLVPARKAKYSGSCADGDAVACMQLAQLNGGLERLDEVCTHTKGLSPASKGTLKTCEGGDARACWQRAGTLVREKRYELPEVSTAGVLGGLGMRGSGSNQDPEELKARLEAECNDQKAGSCVWLGALLKDAGEDPVPLFRRGCQLGDRWGCQRLATELLESGKKEAIGEAVAVLQSACGGDSAESCSRLSRLFHAGKKVAKSDACAVAYGWQNCDPTNRYSCEDLNRLFHPEK